MKILSFQARRFWWKTSAKGLTEVTDITDEREVRETVVVFVHAEPADEKVARRASILRQTLKHVKWLAHKKSMKNVVLHFFAHLGNDDASPEFARGLIEELAARLRTADFNVWLTPFGYFCEWELSVYGESIAKVWKEIR